MENVNIIKDRWIIKERLPLKKREVLFIILETLGFSIYYITRGHTQMEDFPFVMNTGKHICGCMVNFDCDDEIEVSYDDVIEEARKILTYGH